MSNLLKVHKIFGREFQILRLEKGSPLREKAPINEIDEQLRFGTSTVWRLWPTRWALSIPKWTGRHENEDQALATALRSITADIPDVDCYRCHEHKAEYRDKITCPTCLMAEKQCPHPVYHYFCYGCWQQLFWA